MGVKQGLKSNLPKSLGAPVSQFMWPENSSQCPFFSADTAICQNSATTCHRQVRQGSLSSIVHQFSERTRLSVMRPFLSIGTFFNKLPKSESEEEASHPAPHEGNPSVCEG
ncbi:hypothetical protein CDAR_265971 [Caerostris darwini]|uniref:Uncharacterized protein n=1 Tax=Caerostris darwini TaxID=1538125 RepID=A0AAV4QQF0_9ARAC|nr:hypothetical protein CDAR_265971 [Caerostris darwini]